MNEKTLLKEIVIDLGDSIFRILSLTAAGIRRNKKKVFNWLLGCFIGVYLMESNAIDFTIVQKIITRNSEILENYVPYLFLALLTCLLMYMILGFIYKSSFLISYAIIFISITLIIILNPIILVCGVVVLALIYKMQRIRAQNKLQEKIEKLGEYSCPYEKEHKIKEIATSVSSEYGVPVYLQQRMQFTGTAIRK